MDTTIAIFAAVAAVAAAGLMVWRWSVGKQIAVMAGMQTTRVADVAALAPGTFIEAKGILRVREPLTAEYSQKPCAYFVAEIEREETYYERDSKGESQRRTRHTTVYSNTKYGSCLIEDESGRVGIDFDGATVEAVESINEPTASPAGAISGVLNAISGTSESYRRKERILEPDISVYVLGEVQPGGLIGKPLQGSKTKTFLISHKSEEERTKSLTSTMRWLMISAIVLVAVAVALFVWAIKKGSAPKAADAAPFSVTLSA